MQVAALLQLNAEETAAVYCQQSVLLAARSGTVRRLSAPGLGFASSKGLQCSIIGLSAQSSNIFGRDTCTESKAAAALAHSHLSTIQSSTMVQA